MKAIDANNIARPPAHDETPVLVMSHYIGLVVGLLTLWITDGPLPGDYGYMLVFVAGGLFALTVVSDGSLRDVPIINGRQTVIGAVIPFFLMMAIIVYRQWAHYHMPLEVVAPLLLVSVGGLLIAGAGIFVWSPEIKQGEWTIDQPYQDKGKKRRFGLVPRQLPHRDVRVQSYAPARNYEDERRDDGGRDQGGQSIRFRARRAKVDFSQVIGMKEFKKEMLEVGREIVECGGNRNGILLSGDPGNGKSFLAEALAGEFQIPIVRATFGDVASQWVNQTTRDVMQAFDDALAQAPCVLFLDEVDSLLVNRGGIANADSESGKTVDAILTRLTDLRGTGVVIVAATNHPDRLDSASTREERFDFKIEVPPPDLQARIGLLKLGLKGVSYNQEDIERAAKRWEGFSVARIRAVATEAEKSANGRSVDFTTLSKALRKVQGKMGHRLPESVKTLDQTVLGDELRNRLTRLAKRLIDYDKVERMGGSLPSGVVFYGPPGNGKTRAAMSLAKTAGWAFLQTTGQELQADPKKIDELAAKAKDIRPVIVFIDEADDVLRQRNLVPGYERQVTNKLISIMEGAGGKLHDVVWIAATNFPDTLDDGATRGGRFAEKIGFDDPDQGTLERMIENWFTGKPVKLDAILSVDAIARKLDGISFANADAVLTEATTIAVLDRGEGARLRLEDINDAIEALGLA